MAAASIQIPIFHRQVSSQDEFLQPAGDGQTWVALYTLPHRESRVARHCAYHGVHHYLPLRNCALATQDNQPEAEPLFAGYVFACLDGETRHDLLITGTIARVIAVPSERDFLEELRQVRTALEAGAGLETVPALRRGDWVRVVRGLLAGVRGRVVDLRRRRRRRGRLVLNVSLLGRAAAVEVHLDDVQRINPGPELAWGEDSPAVAIVA